MLSSARQNWPDVAQTQYSIRCCTWQESSCGTVASFTIRCSGGKKHTHKCFWKKNLPDFNFSLKTQLSSYKNSVIWRSEMLSTCMWTLHADDLWMDDKTEHTLTSTSCHHINLFSDLTVLTVDLLRKKLIKLYTDRVKLTDFTNWINLLSYTRNISKHPTTYKIDVHIQ